MIMLEEGMNMGVDEGRAGHEAQRPHMLILAMVVPSDTLSRNTGSDFYQSHVHSKYISIRSITILVVSASPVFRPGSSKT